MDHSNNKDDEIISIIILQKRAHATFLFNIIQLFSLIFLISISAYNKRFNVTRALPCIEFSSSPLSSG